MISIRNIHLPISKFWTIFSFLFFFTHIGIQKILGEITAFAPDEKNYVQIFSGIYTDNFQWEPYAGWSTESVLFLRFLYAPAKFISYLGVSDLQSVRVYSSIVWFIAMIILCKSAGSQTIFGTKKRTLIAIGAFFPTITLWTSLGLRESFIYFWLVCIFSLLSFRLRLSKLSFTLLLTVCSLGLGLTKHYLYVLLIISTSMGVLLSCLKLKKLPLMYFLTVLSVLMPLLLSPSLKKEIVNKTYSLVVIGIKDPAISDLGDVVNDAGGGDAGNAKSNTLSSQATTGLFSQMEKLKVCESFYGARICREMQYILRNETAKSTDVLIEDFQRRSLNPVTFDRLGNFPGSMLRILFVPFPFTDNGSFFLDILSFESFFWWIVYLFLFYIILESIKKKVDYELSSRTACSFILIFIIFSTFIETNIGTALRHRSILLILVLFILAQIKLRKSNQVNS